MPILWPAPKNQKRGSPIEYNGQDNRRTARAKRFLSETSRDLGYAWRLAKKRPGFSAAVVVTLALGIGGNTAIFGLVNAVVFSPLPYPDAEELVSVLEVHASEGSRVPSYPTYRDWESQTDVFERIAFVRGAAVGYRTEESSGLLVGSFVTTDFFDLLDAQPVIGRVLTSDDYAPDADGAVVLSHRAWERWFGGDPSVLGSTLVADGLPFTVVGVLPAYFAYPDWGVENDLWMPMARLRPAALTALNQRGVFADSRVVARLRKNVSRDQARIRIESLAAVLAAEYPETNAGWTQVRVESLKELEVSAVRARLFMLWGAAGFVLLLCCLNLANLYIVHGKSRSSEYALRAALGARRARVFRQIFMETLVLAVLGGALGVFIAWRSLAWAKQGGLPDLPRVNELGVTSSVLLFSLCLAIGTAMVFAFLANRHAGRGSLRPQVSSDNLRSFWTAGLPSWIQGAQVGVTFVLLIGAWLLGSSFLRLTAVEPGYDPIRLVVVPINPPSPNYDNEEAALGLYGALIEAVSNVPGVTDVVLTNHGPGGRAGAPTPASVGGMPQDTEDDISVLYRTVSAGYFGALGISIVEGREFDDADLVGGEGPVVVNQTLASRWRGRSPLGETLGVRKAASTRSDFGEPLIGRIVGVVADLDPTETGGTTMPLVYVPYTHSPWAQVRLLARVVDPSVEALRSLEEAVGSVDPAIPLSGPFVSIRRAEDLRSAQRSDERLNAGLVTVFALVALFLASIGMYGVVSYTVVLRRKAIGVRLALGATAGQVVWGVVRRVMFITLGGLLAGALAAFVLAKAIEGLLFEIQPMDVAPYLWVGSLLLVLAIAASYRPAAKAGRLDPVAVLRAD